MPVLNFNINVRPEVQLTDTVNYWRELTNELRRALVADFNFIRFDESLDEDVTLENGGFITTQQEVADGTNLTVGSGATLTHLTKNDQAFGKIRREFLIEAADVGNVFSTEAPINSSGTIDLTIKTDNTRISFKRYMFITTNEDLFIEFMNGFEIGADNVGAVTTNDAEFRFTSTTEGDAYVTFDFTTNSLQDF